MDKFVIRKGTDCGGFLKRKREERSDVQVLSAGADEKPESPAKKVRKYDNEYLKIGFTNIIVDGKERPQCVVCLAILAPESMKPSKLRRHLETRHAELACKPLEFFERKLQEYKRDKKTFVSHTSIHKKALMASYQVSYRIAQNKKAHTIGESLILPAAMDIVRTMIGEDAATQLQAIPLSNDTVRRRITEMSEDVSDQLISRINNQNFALQLDEATDTAGDSHLIAYIRYVWENNLLDDFLFCKKIERRATAQDLFGIVDDFLKDQGISWSSCVGVCTDGAPAMAGKKQGLQSLIKNVAPDVVWTHCMIHREVLASKDLSVELNTVLTDVIKMVNFVKNSSARSRLFSLICQDMEANYDALLYYCESRWLSRGKALARVFELREELWVFLNENSFNKADLLKNDRWLLLMAYLSDIFEKLNGLNTSMQGKDTTILQTTDKINAFVRKISLWTQKIRQENSFDMFPCLCKCKADVDLSLDQVKNVIIAHLNGLQERFQHYFAEIDVTKYDWIRNPFLADPSTSGLSTEEEEQLIELSSDQSLKMVFQTTPVPKFWISVNGEYPLLSEKAMKVLLPFSTSYMCEQGFSALAALKSKYRNRLDAEADLRIAVGTNIAPRFASLCNSKQAQPSH